MTATANVATSVAERVNLRRRLPSVAMRRALRQSTGLSCAELAEILGVTRQAVSKWERGERFPSGDYLRAYVDALDELAAQERAPRRDVAW